MGSFVSKSSMARLLSTRDGSWKDPTSKVYHGIELLNAEGSFDCKKRSVTEPTDVVASKGSFSTFMEKEIFDQPYRITQQVKGRVNVEEGTVTLQALSGYEEEIMRCRRLILVGAASSYHAAIGTRQLMEELLELPVFVELASDFLDRSVPIFRDDVCIFISQSGETSSVLSACLYCKRRDALVVAITNDEDSSLASHAEICINIHAGIEIGVASTKTYTSQFLTLVFLALYLAKDKRSKLGRRLEIINEIALLPGKIERVLKLNDQLKELAREIGHSKSLLVMGRGYQQATCLEGSFKFKEVANMHSEGIHSGELKHGPLALIDSSMPVIMIIMRDHIYDKCINAIQQVRARNGRPILICEEGDEPTMAFGHRCIEVPKTSDCLAGILTVIPLQLLSLHLAILRRKDVDNPRHLAKTVIEDEVFVMSC